MRSLKTKKQRKRKAPKKNKEKKAKLKKFQEKLTEVVSIQQKKYYEEQFIIVQTWNEFYILLELSAPPVRLMNNEDINYLVEEEAKGYRTLNYRIKYIIDTDYIDLSEQKKYQLDVMQQLTTDDIFKRQLIEERLRQFEYQEKEGQKEVYFVKIFGQTGSEAMRHAYDFMSSFDVMALPFNLEKTKIVVRLEHNPLERRKKEHEVIG